jgi:hypothetical protein
MKKKKLAPVIAPPTTQELIATATKKVESDIIALDAQKDSALSMFRSTASKLEAVNKGLMNSVEDLNTLIEFATEKKESAEKAISDNEAVRKKILDILGE